MQQILLDKRFRLLGMIVVLMVLWVSAGTAQALQATERRPQRPGPTRDSRPGIERRAAVDRHYNDLRHRHNRPYPVRGTQIRALPKNRHAVVHKGSRFYFSGGIWYRPYGSRFIIAAPPIGLFVPFLPSYYATIWVGGAPYYYANEVYYAHSGNGYVVVESPKQETVSEVPPPAEQMFIYPRLDQSEQQQADDRYVCHQWAVDQTGFDPTQPQSGTAERIRLEKRADYQRAMAACLEGKGYTVK
jgi:hypothetical protein